jgi:hypothetical protein
MIPRSTGQRRPIGPTSVGPTSEGSPRTYRLARLRRRSRPFAHLHAFLRKLLANARNSRF